MPGSKKSQAHSTSSKRSRSSSSRIVSLTAASDKNEDDGESMMEVSSVSSAVMRRNRVNEYANEQLLRRLGSSGSSFGDLSESITEDPLHIFREDDEEANPGVAVPHNRPDYKNKARRWMLTGFQGCPYIPERSPVRYYVWTHEHTQEERDHWHIYLQLDRSERMSFVKNLVQRAPLGDEVGDPCTGLVPYKELHCEFQQKSTMACIKYCKKERTRVPGFSPVEWGVAEFTTSDKAEMAQEKGTAQKKSSMKLMLERINELVLDGRASKEVKQLITREFPTIAFLHDEKLERSLQRTYMCSENAVSKFRPVLVIVFYGETGTGKSRAVFNNWDENDIYMKTILQGKWWNGYQQEKVMFLDDFTTGEEKGEPTAPEMLQLLDERRLFVQTKGGMTYSNWDTVIISSNYHPDEWYPTVKETTRKAVLNRIRVVVTFTGESNRGKMLGDGDFWNPPPYPNRLDEFPFLRRLPKTTSVHFDDRRMLRSPSILHTLPEEEVVINEFESNNENKVTLQDENLRDEAGSVGVSEVFLATQL